MMRRYQRRGGAHVYIAVARWRYGVKVGFSERPVQRVCDLEQKHKAPVYMAYATAMRMDAFKVERRAHQLLSAAARGGEWFAVDVATAKAAVRRAQQDVEAGWKWPRMACHDARRGKRFRPRTGQKGGGPNGRVPRTTLRLDLAVPDATRGCQNRANQL